MQAPHSMDIQLSTKQHLHVYLCAGMQAAHARICLFPTYEALLQPNSLRLLPLHGLHAGHPRPFVQLPHFQQLIPSLSATPFANCAPTVPTSHHKQHALRAAPCLHITWLAVSVPVRTSTVLRWHLEMLLPEHRSVTGSRWWLSL